MRSEFSFALVQFDLVSMRFGRREPLWHMNKNHLDPKIKIALFGLFVFSCMLRTAILNQFTSSFRCAFDAIGGYDNLSLNLLTPHYQPVLSSLFTMCKKISFGFFLLMHTNDSILFCIHASNISWHKHYPKTLNKKMLSVWKYILNIFWVFQTSYLFFNELLPFRFLTVNICDVMNAWPLNSWKKNWPRNNNKEKKTYCYNRSIFHQAIFYLSNRCRIGFI